MIESAARLSGAEWLRHPDSSALMQALFAAGGEARFVGGCVRNALLGEDVADLDVATTLPPDRAMAALEQAGIKCVPTGIAHGTVTAVLPSRHYEVTTLRIDVATDGRHADVAFTVDWAADAARRDFTINALYADAQGVVYDPLGEGFDDLEARRVRFIGDAAMRISEDYLRILRFFRFHGRYGRGPLDADGVNAVMQAREGMRQLSGERIRDELLKLIVHDSASAMFAAMAEAGVLAIVLPEAKHLDALAEFIVIDQQHFFEPDSILRLGALLDGESVDDVASRLRLSNHDRDRLRHLYGDKTSIVSDMSPRELRRTLYAVGYEVFRDRVMLEWARIGASRNAPQWRALLALAETWQIPKFPLTGDMIKAAGVPEGPLVGRVRQEVEAWWIDSDFTTDEPALFERLKAVVQGVMR